jgi:hypothetical protein
MSLYHDISHLHVQDREYASAEFRSLVELPVPRWPRPATRFPYCAAEGKIQERIEFSAA